jgi:hypothetical protein
MFRFHKNSLLSLTPFSKDLRFSACLIVVLSFMLIVQLDTNSIIQLIDKSLVPIFIPQCPFAAVRANDVDFPSGSTSFSCVSYRSDRELHASALQGNSA